jgi:hypothetical protein
MSAGTSRLARLARGSAGTGAVRSPDGRAEQERCELCAEPLDPEHRHLVDLDSRALLCACRACSILFDRSGAGGGHYRLVPDRIRIVSDLDLDDVTWQSFGIPVGLAFFFASSAAGRVVAFYPSPLGATESLLELGVWEDVVAANPVLSKLEPDVEALLVDRTNGRKEHWLLPIDRCYELVGLVRAHWKGFSGGAEVWDELERWFGDLRRRAVGVTRQGKEERWDSKSASPT